MHNFSLNDSSNILLPPLLLVRHPYILGQPFGYTALARNFGLAQAASISVEIPFLLYIFPAGAGHMFHTRFLVVPFFRNSIHRAPLCTDQAFSLGVKQAIGVVIGVRARCGLQPDPGHHRSYTVGFPPLCDQPVAHTEGPSPEAYAAWRSDHLEERKYFSDRSNFQWRERIGATALI